MCSVCTSIKAMEKQKSCTKLCTFLRVGGSICLNVACEIIVCRGVELVIFMGLWKMLNPCFGIFKSRKWETLGVCVCV